MNEDIYIYNKICYNINVVSFQERFFKFWYNASSSLISAYIYDDFSVYAVWWFCSLWFFDDSENYDWSLKILTVILIIY